VDDAQRLQRLAVEAAALVEDGMALGLGTGSTADAIIKELGKRVTDGLRISGVATSSRTKKLAGELGIPLNTLDEVKRLDLGIDGADEIAPNVDVVKGRGGALLYEKLVALACDSFLIVAASEKLVDKLGTRMPLPIEVVPFGWEQTKARLEHLGFETVLRPGDGEKPYVTDGGHYILDAETGAIDDPAALAAAIKAITGVVDHGIFAGTAGRAMVVDPDGTVRTLKR
jgi:ribose 5-phosphate isomerase A